MQSRPMTLLPLIAATYFIVAGGPFGLEDIVASAGYGGALLILIITPLIWSLPTGLMVAELASALPEEGGYYRWVRRALGPFWGFQEAWLSLVGSIFDMAIYPTLFIGYLGHFSPGLTADGRGLWIGVAMIACCALWNLGGARVVGESSVAMGLLLLSPFAVLTAWAVLHPVAAGTVATPVARNHNDIISGILVAMWNYMGWDNTSTIAGEVERPQRTYPLAMLGAIALVTTTYLMPVGAVALTGLSPDAWTTGGWASVARAVMGSTAAGTWTAIAITVAGMVGAVGTMTGLTMSLSRLPMTLAEDGYLPKAFLRRNSAGAPWVAIAVCAVVWALCLNLSFSRLIVLDVLLTGLSIVLEFAALVALRLREPGLDRPYKVPGGTAGAIFIGLFPTLLLILTMVRTETETVGPISAFLFGLMLICLGCLIYALSFRERFRTPDTAVTPRKI